MDQTNTSRDKSTPKQKSVRQTLRVSVGRRHSHEVEEVRRMYVAEQMHVG